MTPPPEPSTTKYDCFLCADETDCADLAMHICRDLGYYQFKCCACDFQCFTRTEILQHELESQHQRREHKSSGRNWVVSNVIRACLYAKKNGRDMAMSLVVDPKSPSTRLVATELYLCILCERQVPGTQLIEHVSSELNGRHRYSCSGCRFRSQDFMPMLQHQMENGHQFTSCDVASTEWVLKNVIRACMHAKRCTMASALKLFIDPGGSGTKPSLSREASGSSPSKDSQPVDSSQRRRASAPDHVHEEDSFKQETAVGSSSGGALNVENTRRLAATFTRKPSETGTDGLAAHSGSPPHFTPLGTVVEKNESSQTKRTHSSTVLHPHGDPTTKRHKDGGGGGHHNGHHNGHR